MGFRLRDQALQHVHLQAQVGRAILVAEALAEADRVEEVGLAVSGDGRLGELPVGIEPLVLAHVPHAVRGVSVAPALLRQEVRLHRVEELVRRAGVPVAHRAEVLGHHHATVKGVVEHGLAQESAELERPEERAVVVALHRLGEGLRGVGVVHHVGIRLLERVVHADARHDEVEAALDAPVDLAFPILEPPVLGLEAREAAVREVTEAAELEGGMLKHVKPRDIRRGTLRHHVAVPEPAAAAAPLKEVVDGIERAASVDGGELQSGGIRLHPVRVVPVLRRRQRGESDRLLARRRGGNNRQPIAADLLPVARQLLRGDPVRLLAACARQHDLHRSRRRCPQDDERTEDRGQKTKDAGRTTMDG